MTEIPIASVVAHRSGLPEEPGFRNDGLLLVGDDELQITTSWWNWARHMAWPLGLITCDLSAVFAGPDTTRKFVMTMPRDNIASIVLHPDALPLPRVDIVGVREEDGQDWRCSFAYRPEQAPLVERLQSYIPEEREASRSTAPD